MATPDIEKKLRGLPAIGEAYERAREIDIIVTSTSGWRDDHSMLRNYMGVAGESVSRLENEGCIGDMLWQPIGPKGPLELQMQMRVMTVMKLNDVIDHVANKKQVLLVAGPCASCHTPKSDVVDAILGQEQRLVTHLAVDSRCVRGLRSRRAERVT
jgi:DNA-binding transcriptional regulator LsrR (DeoR family)